MLQHAVFLDALARINDETNPTWKTTLAGFVVLRLVDNWLDLDTTTIAADRDGLQMANAAIAAIPGAHPARTPLRQLLQAVRSPKGHPFRKIVPSLIEYGHALHHTGQWILAKDVFSTLLVRSQQFEEATVYLRATLRLAYTMRRLSEYQNAEATYTLAEDQALRLRNIEDRLLAQTGIALVVGEREGDLQKADALLTQVIQQAQPHNYTPVIAGAWQNRGYCNHTRGRYVEALECSYRALEYTSDRDTHLQIFGNIAAVLADLGQIDTASELHVWVLASSSEAWHRHRCLVNLLEISFLQGNEQSFHTYRRLLAGSQLDPYLDGWYHKFLSRGYERFGRLEDALREREITNQIIARNNINVLLSPAVEN